MALIQDQSNGIITMDTTSQEVAGQVAIEGVLFYGSAAGVSILTDSNGNVIAKAGLTAQVLTLFIPLKRYVNGIKAGTIATNQAIMVFLKQQ